MRQVTAAIIINDGKVLIAKRAKDQNQADKWEFPGGKTEQGETPEECLTREISEELGIDIKVERSFDRSVYKYDTGEIELLAYEAQWIDGECIPKVHSEIKWVEANELENYDFAPADIPFVKKLKGR